MQRGDQWMCPDGWGWGGWTLMAIAMVLFWAAIIAIIVFAVRYLISARGRSVSSDRAVRRSRAEDILAERYAQDKIDCRRPNFDPLRLSLGLRAERRRELLAVEDWAEIRRLHRAEGLPIRRSPGR